MQLIISGVDWQMIMTSGVVDWLFDVTRSFDVWLGGGEEAGSNTNKHKCARNHDKKIKVCPWHLTF